MLGRMYWSSGGVTTPGDAAAGVDGGPSSSLREGIFRRSPTCNPDLLQVGDRLKIPSRRELDGPPSTPAAASPGVVTPPDDQYILPNMHLKELEDGRTCWIRNRPAPRYN